MSDDEINRVIEDHIKYSIERVKNDMKSVEQEPTVEYLESWGKERLIKRATELSETGIPTLESVKAAIKEREDEYEKLIKGIKRAYGSGRIRAISIIVIWVVFAFLLSLAINLAFWGVITTSTGLQKEYWEFLFAEGLWTFLVGGFGSIVIMVLFNELT